ncbi:chemotaxis protein CheX [Gemmatimonas sp.]|jgi:CheY-specific phosphatase CheX|uniref:chemotaxis protein CheX n=1 Tax=Gemmatimonas sp. TaxID=1962908 RepID=UPI0037BE26DC
MSSTTAQSLSRATTATFEELALLFPELDLSAVQAAAPLDVAVSVEFRGPLTGRLVVRASQCLLPAIAANMLGAEESKQAPLQRDALGEVGNVICGHVLPLIAGADKLFNLAAPLVVDGDELPHRDDDEPAARVQIGVEDGRVETVLYLFDTQAAAA